MNTTQHTPTPWLACENGLARNKFGETQWTIGPALNCLATVHRRADDGAQMKADAKFILRAVNSHAQLVAALEALTFETSHHLQSGDRGALVQNAIRNACAALTAAKENA